MIEEEMTLHESKSTIRTELIVNGEDVSEDVEARLLLIYFLRRKLGLRSPHVGCDTTNCGACTVLMDGVAIKSCTIFAYQANGHEVTTLEGISDSDKLHPLQKAFTEKHALQCGYCTPGMIMASISLLKRTPDPTEQEIRNGISGNLCMCTGYLNIIEAIKKASEDMKDGGSVSHE